MAVDMSMPELQKMALSQGFHRDKVLGLKKPELLSLMKEYGTVHELKRERKLPTKMPLPKKPSGVNMGKLLTTPVSKQKAGLFGMTALFTMSGGYVVSKEILDRYAPEKDNRVGAGVIGIAIGATISWLATNWIKGS